MAVANSMDSMSSIASLSYSYTDNTSGSVGDAKRDDGRPVSVGRNGKISSSSSASTSSLVTATGATSTSGSGNAFGSAFKSGNTTAIQNKNPNSKNPLQNPNWGSDSGGQGQGRGARPGSTGETETETDAKAISMEDFEKLMDTLAMQPKKKSKPKAKTRNGSKSHGRVNGTNKDNYNEDDDDGDEGDDDDDFDEDDEEVVGNEKIPISKISLPRAAAIPSGPGRKSLALQGVYDIVTSVRNPHNCVGAAFHSEKVSTVFCVYKM